VCECKHRHTLDCSCVRSNKKQYTSHEFINCKQNFAKLVTKFESVRNKLSSAFLLTQLNKSYFTVSRLSFRQKTIRTQKAQCLTSRYSSPLSSSLYSSSPLSPHHFLVTLIFLFLLWHILPSPLLFTLSYTFSYVPPYPSQITSLPYGRNKN
jgi:hypothetical protein